MFDVDSGIPIDNGPHPRAFVTSTSFTGDLASEGSAITGVAGGDNLCQTAATSANLSGTFKAWLSDSATNAIDRLVDVGGWYTVGPTAFMLFANKAALTAGPLGGITDEHGVGADGEPWTGTKADGTKETMDAFLDTSANCLGWTTDSMDSGATGAASTTGSSWTESAAYQCQNLRPLYCFQQ